MEDSVIPNSFSKRGIYTSENIGFGYIVLPKNRDREEYIKEVYVSHILSIFDPITQSPYLNCLVDKEKLKEIIFPPSTDLYGSPVLFIKLPTTNTVVVFSVLKQSNEYLPLEENGFHKQVVSDDVVIDVFAKAKQGVFDVQVSSNNKRAVQLNIRAKNTNKTAQINIECTGEVTFSELTNLTVLSEDFKLILKDSKDTQLGFIDFSKDRLFVKDVLGNTITSDKQGIALNTKSGQSLRLMDKGILLETESGQFFEISDDKWYLANNKQKTDSVAVAEEVIDLFSELIDHLINPSIYVSPGGPAPLSTAPLIQAMKTKLQKIKSEFVLIPKKV